MSIFDEISLFKSKLVSGLAQKKDLTKIKLLLKHDISVLPNYINQYLSDIEKICKITKKNNKDITILDHGCGSGTVVILLLALGYESIYGLDVKEEKCFKYNKSLRKILNINRDIFITYDNGKIPLPDDSVNYIYSNQVLEHVAPNLIDEFLFEEHRIKNQTSIIRHSFPVRNCFFETHTNTAILHWFLPRKIFYRLFSKQKQVWLENNLFLNWSKYYEKKFHKCLGSFSQENLSRNFYIPREDYDGGLIKFYVRRVCIFAINIRLFSPIIKNVFKVLATREFVQRNNINL